MRHFIWCLLLGMLAPIAAMQAQNQGQLVVFVQPGRSISQDFIRTALPKIESLSKRQSIPLKVVDATKGAPAEVTLTPAVFYQKGDEYLPYEGRYKDMDELGSFVRNNGKNSMATAPKRKKMTTWKSGRTTVAAHDKMHPVDGNANGFDEAQAWASMTKNLAYLREANPAALPGTARSFYLEFYPEKTADDLMLIQMKLYSEFDLENPVFVSDVPSGSEWDEWELAFEKAGKRLEAMLFAQVGSNENGDGFEPVRSNVPVKSWNALVTVDADATGFTAKTVGR